MVSFAHFVSRELEGSGMWLRHSSRNAGEEGRGVWLCGELNVPIGMGNCPWNVSKDVTPKVA